MVRLIAIACLIALAVILFRYRTHEKVQRTCILVVVGAFFIYTGSLMVAELIR